MGPVASYDELKDRVGWKSRVMVDRYAKFATEHLTVAAERIQRGRDRNVIDSSRFVRAKKAKSCALTKLFEFVVGRVGIEPTTNGLRVRCSTS